MIGNTSIQGGPPSPAYALRALDAEAQEVASAQVGSRSAALNRAAFNLGQLVVAGVLGAEVVETVLFTAADQCGLTRKNGKTDVQRTIAKGIEAGELRPRERQFSGVRADGQARAQAKARADALRRQREEEARIRRAFCERAWTGTQSASDGVVEGYLFSRGLERCPPVLRFHAAAPLGYEGKRHAPAMVALVQGGNGEPVGLHVTPLEADGSAIARGCKRLIFGLLGESATGWAVRLSDYTDELAVAEGIETALAYQQLFNVPTWAVLSTSGLRRFRPPPGLRRLVIAADRDDTGDGMAAAHDIAEIARKVCDVDITPAPIGQDWNDVLRGRK